MKWDIAVILHHRNWALFINLVINSDKLQYAVKAQTSLAPLSRFCGSHITTAHEQQCCRFQSYAKTVPSCMKPSMKFTKREPHSWDPRQRTTWSGLVMKMENLENDSKISNFGSVVCFLGPILWDKPQNFPFQLMLYMNESHFGLPVVSSNPINSDNVHSLHHIMAIDKVIWINAHNCGRPKWHSFTSSISWNGKFWASTLSDKMRPRKQTTEPKLLILV